jgi:hypothetical protein
MIDHQAWQQIEQGRINELEKLVMKLEGGSTIDIWDVAPELNLNKSKRIWSMLDPKDLKNGKQLSMPQIFLLPINPPQYEGFTFEREYGKSPSWVAQLIKQHPENIKPIITGQPIDYKPYPQYEEVFEASRRTYCGDLPPCTQWRVESLIAKYRMAIDHTFVERYSPEYYKLAKDPWASQIMMDLGLSKKIEPLSVEGRKLRHFLANNYSLACFGLSEIVDNVIHASSTIPNKRAEVKMQAAWRILDPYIEYLVSPLRNDLTGLSARTTTSDEIFSKLQLILPMLKDENAFSKIQRCFGKSKESSDNLDLIRRLDPKVPLELILRLNSSTSNCLFLPAIDDIEKSDIKYAVCEEGDQYATSLYDVWATLYKNGKLDKKALGTLYEQSKQYTENIQGLAAKKLNKKIKIEKLKISAGAFGSGFFAFYGLSNFSEFVFPSNALANIFWIAETTFSFIGAIKEIKDALKLTEVAKSHVADSLARNVVNGNIVTFEMAHMANLNT